MDSFLPTVSDPVPAVDLSSPYSASYFQWYSYYSGLNQQMSCLDSSMLGTSGSVSALPNLPFPTYTPLDSSNLSAWNGYLYPTDFSPSPVSYELTPLDSPNFSSSSTSTVSPIFTSSAQLTPPPEAAPATAPATGKKTAKKDLICTNCMATETAKWRNVRKVNVLCNACFVYERKYKRCRPLGTTNRKKNANTDPY